MDAIIADMERLPIDINNGKPVIPLIDREVCRMQFTKAPDRIRGGEFAIHVALGVFARLVVVSLHGRDLTPQEQASGDIDR